MRTILYFSIIIGLIPFFLAKNTHEDLILRKKVIRNPFPIISGLLLISFIVILMTANRTGYDARAFHLFYSDLLSSRKNPWDYSYQALADLMISIRPLLLNITYDVFHAVVVLCSIIITVLLYSEYVTNFHTVAFVFVASGLYAEYGMQFKNAISVTLLLIAILFYVKYSRMKRYVLFYIFAFLAVIMHFSFFIYLVIPVIETKFFQRNKKLFPIIGTVVYFVILLSGGAALRFVYNIFAQIPYLNKIASYGYVTAGIRSAGPVLIYLGIFVVLYFCLDRDGRLSEGKTKLQNMVFDIWMMFGIFLPALYTANAVGRIYTNLYVIVFIVICNSVISLPRLSKNRLILSLGVFVMIAVLYSYQYILGSYIDIYIPVFEGKYFWQK